MEMNAGENTAPTRRSREFFSARNTKPNLFKCLLTATFCTFSMWSSPVITFAAPFQVIANDVDDTVSVIDTATNNLVATVTVDLGPEGVAINPLGTRVYVTNLSDETVSVIDTTTNTLVATVPVDVDPFGIAVNSAGTRIYVTDLFDNSVSIIDADTNSLLGTVNLGN